jgi:hypothetical protein
MMPDSPVFDHPFLGIQGFLSPSRRNRFIATIRQHFPGLDVVTEVDV